MSTLFNGDNSDSEEELKINTGYASSYNNWRQKEELNKLKTKYGNLEDNSGLSDDGDSEETSEDEEEEEELKEQFDKDFYKTLAYLKNKDPKIYKADVSFFSNTNKAQEEKSLKKKSGERNEKEKAVFLRDYERQIIVERDGKFSDSEDEERTRNNQKSKSDNITYVEEQQRLKDSFKSVLVDDDAGEGSSDLLKPKTKSQSEKEREEADYKQWLKGQQAKIDEEEEKELKPLRDFWTNPKLDANEKFLRDYILNNKHLEKAEENGDLDYEQIVHDSDDNLSEDENNIEKQEEFEHKYNFRFEEPDQEFIKRYPRTLENSLRKKDTRRAQKRVEVKQRKEEEKLRKKEELKQLKALKRKEIEEKIDKLKEITGNDDIQFDSINLDDDFDPNEYDRKMAELFNDEYYAAPEGDIKPEFPEVDAELEIEHTWDSYDPTNVNNLNKDDEYPHCEDESFNMDADYDETKAQQDELIESSRKKKRKRSKFADLISKQKPKFNPTEYRSYEEYFDKYYSLDYEDMIGDLPCRFKYRKVVPNDYGLSVEEILTADDKELNKWCSLKKALQHKPEHVELNEVRTYKEKARNDGLKRRILSSLYRYNSYINQYNKLGLHLMISFGGDDMLCLWDTMIMPGWRPHNRSAQKLTLPDYTNFSTPNDEHEGENEIGEGEQNQNSNFTPSKQENEPKKKKPRRGSKKTAGLNSNNVSSNKSRKNGDISNKEDAENPSEKGEINITQATSSEKRKAECNDEPVKKKRKHGKSQKAAAEDENQQETSNKKAQPHNRITEAGEMDSAIVESKSSKLSKESTKKSKSKKKFGKKQKNPTKVNGKQNTTEDVLPMDPQRLKTYGINPKKLKKKLKYGKMKT